MVVEGEKKKFALDKVSGIVYDWNSYELARDMGGDPLIVGKLIQGQDGKQKFVKGSSSVLRESGAVAMAAPKSTPVVSTAPVPTVPSSKKPDKAKDSTSSKPSSLSKGKTGES